MQMNKAKKTGRRCWKKAKRAKGGEQTCKIGHFKNNYHIYGPSFEYRLAGKVDFYDGMLSFASLFITHPWSYANILTSEMVNRDGNFFSYHNHLTIFPMTLFFFQQKITENLKHGIEKKNASLYHSSLNGNSWFIIENGLLWFCHLSTYDIDGFRLLK